MEDKNNAGNNSNTAGNEGNESGTSPEMAKLQEELAAKEAAIAAKDKELQKANADKEIYKNGLLEMKERGKKRLTPEEMADPNKITEFVEAKVNEELESKRLQEEALKKAESDEALRKRNEELELALESMKATGKMPVSESSESANTPPVNQNSYWSMAQKAELRKIYESRGIYSKDQIDRMVDSAEKRAKTNSGALEGNFGYSTERKH